MNIRGFHITEKKVATACVIVLLVVSLFAAIKQTNATAEIKELSNDRMTKKAIVTTRLHNVSKK